MRGACAIQMPAPSLLEVAMNILRWLYALRALRTLCKVACARFRSRPYIKLKKRGKAANDGNAAALSSPKAKGPGPS